MVENPPANAVRHKKCGFDPWVWKIPWRRAWKPTAVFLPGGSHGQRSLVGCSPWGRGGSDTTKRVHFHFSLSCTGEGNGNPLQCSCLENPRDGGAWWASVYGVTQSRTRLKRLSSSMVTVLISPGGIYKSRTTGSRGNSVFKFLMGHQTVFPSGCFILQSYH